MANLILIVSLAVGGLAVFTLRGGKVMYAFLPILAAAAAVVQIVVLKTAVIETLLF